ncbi:MAG: hypothetical protein U0270_04025 [Labilithrix sp.]
MSKGRDLLFFCVLAPAVAGACTGLKSALEVTVTGPEAGAPSPSGNGDDDDVPTKTPGSSNDDPPPDAGVPPEDFSCEKSYWVLDPKPRAECAPRQVRVVSTALLTQSNGVSIARTSAGRIGIAFNFDPDPETTKLRVAHFQPTMPDFAAPIIEERASADFKHVGFMSRLAASAPDTFHVLSFDVDPSSGSGSVTSQKLIDGTGPLTDPETVLTDVPSPTELGFAVDSNKTAYALVRMAAASDKAKLLAFKKPDDGAWTSLPNIPSLGYGLLPKEAPASGASSLVIDGNDRLHVLYHHNEVRFGSTPRYHVLASSAWSYRKTIDNNAPDGWCGFSPRLAVFGPRKYALYFFNRTNQDTPTPTAELRLSTWVSEDDQPTHEVIDQQIPSTSTYAPRYAAAMAIDKFGLIHLAIVRPSPNEQRGFLEYRRQQRVDGGGTRWVSDLVDDDVLSAQSGASVDILVDENARPHIAYVSGKDLRLRYATRYDR